MSEKLGFIGIFSGLLLVGLVLYGLVSGGAILQSDNGLNSTILDDSVLGSSFSSLNKSLKDSTSTADEQLKAFNEDKTTLGFGSILFESLTGITRVFSSMTIGLYNITIVVVANTLGIDPIVISVITSILLLLIIVYTWRLIKQGQ